MRGRDEKDPSAISSMPHAMDASKSTGIVLYRTSIRLRLAAWFAISIDVNVTVYPLSLV